MLDTMRSLSVELLQRGVTTAIMEDAYLIWWLRLACINHRFAEGGLERSLKRMGPLVGPVSDILIRIGEEAEDEGPLPDGRTLLLVGRANFAAAALVATAAFLFVAELSGRRPRLLTPLWLETALLFALSQWTPLVDRAEAVTGGLHATAYGPLFPLYAAHVVAFLAGAVVCTFRPPSGAVKWVRARLRLVGTGILVTALVGVTANVVLLVAVAYAVFFYHLFDVRLVIRAACVYAGLVVLALELYSLVLSFLARLLPLGDAGQRHSIAMAAVLVVNAFTQGPVKL